MQRKVKILFVDDEVRVVKLLRMMFRAKFEVWVATSGAEALEMLAANPVDIVVSDQRMPGMLGIELLAQIRRRWPNTIRLLLTGYSDLVAIIGAVNEGEVYRFLNKPWNHDELKSVIDECAAIALSTDQVLAVAETAIVTTPPLASAAKLLTLEGVPGDQHELMEMFTSDYDVIAASTVEEARAIIREQSVGVMIVGDTAPPGTHDIIDLLREFKESNPYLTIVVVSSGADSDRIVRLINQAHIYRFAMKPISPNVFRLAVSAAMREHHRLLADPRLSVSTARHEPEMAPAIVDSLARFTRVW